MGKQFHEYTRLEKIRAGDIARHPTRQRPSVLRQFNKKLGEFDPRKCVQLIHLIENPKPGTKYLAIDGATRVEACLANKKFGPDTKLDCRIYGNGKPPSDPELADLFLVLNTDKIDVGGKVRFDQSIEARRPSAVFASELVERLGRKYEARTGMWNIVQKYGEGPAEAAVDFAIELWGIEQKIPGQVVKALAAIFYNKEIVPLLMRRRTALKHSTPENIRLRAQQRMLTQVGKRDDLNTWTIKVLLGQRA